MSTASEPYFAPAVAPDLLYAPAAPAHEKADFALQKRKPQGATTLVINGFYACKIRGLLLPKVHEPIGNRETEGAFAKLPLPIIS